jgi:hypothetical protein
LRFLLTSAGITNATIHQRIASSNHVGREASLPVRGECDQAPLTGDDVLDLDCVPGGEDVGVARAHLLVDADAAELSDLDAGHARERGVGTHAEREDCPHFANPLVSSGPHVPWA